MPYKTHKNSGRDFAVVMKRIRGNSDLNEKIESI